MNKIIYILLFIIFSTFLHCSSNTLEYDVKYSENNFILITINKSKYPEIQKKYHIVKKGEDLEDISDESKVELETLECINNMSRFDELKVGQVIHLVRNSQGGETKCKSKEKKEP